MKSLTTILAVLAVATSFAVAQDAKPATGDAKPATGDTKPATGDTKPAEKKAATTAEAPKRDLDAVFKKRDTNGDGSITLEEFKTGAKDPAKAEAAFKRRDKDGDGKITLEEFKAPPAAAAKK